MTTSSSTGSPDGTERPMHPAAAAANWRRVIAVDLGVGIVILAVGAVLMMRVQVVLGSGIGALGLTYDWMVLRRYRQWRAARVAAGLPV